MIFFSFLYLKVEKHIYGLIMYISGVYKINYSNKLNQSIDCLNHQLPPPQVITIVFKVYPLGGMLIAHLLKKNCISFFFFFHVSMMNGIQKGK